LKSSKYYIMFIKKVISLIMIFLIAFTTQVQEREIYEKDSFDLAKIQNSLNVAAESCEEPEIFDYGL
jgi:hypothetical protein